MSNSLGKQKAWTFPPRSTSTMSLPRFRSEKPRLYWPLPRDIDYDEKIEIKIDDPLEDPHMYGVNYLTQVVGSSSNTTVIKGKVLKANHQQELVAVKIMAVQDQKTKAALFGEIRILHSVVHPHIIAAIGSCSTEINGKIRLGILFFPLAKTNLEEHLDKLSMTRDKLELEQLLSYYACLCQAVDYLHTREKPIKHRDIKPSNILIDGEGNVILADFGISKQYDDRTKAITIRGVEYTVKYAPPHVMRQSPAGLEWDVNCLGFVFLEMATVILGKTIEDLLLFLSGSRSIESTTAETEITEIRFSDALLDGRIDSWLHVLRSHALSNLSQLPKGLASSRQTVDEFLNMIDDMMKTPGGRDEGVLARACRVFGSMSEGCEYCRLESGDRGDNNDGQAHGQDLVADSGKPCSFGRASIRANNLKHGSGRKLPLRTPIYGQASGRTLRSQPNSGSVRASIQGEKGKRYG